MTKRYLNEGYRLGPNFTVGAFTASETAEAYGITIRVEKGSDVGFNLRALVEAVLQPIRDELGVPIYVTSGYRPPEVNALPEIGGAPDSQHTTGEAGDVYAVEVSIVELARAAVRLGLPYDQLIVEHDQGVLHVSHTRQRNRREALTRVVDPETGERRYLDGVLTEEAALRTLEGLDAG